jgi:hypothetical protein
VADELKKVFPELVQNAVKPAEYDREDRTKEISPEVEYEAVNYQGLIPVLIASVQELKAENDGLRGEVAELRQMMQELKNSRTSTTSASSAYLEQNSPNPVRSTTSIRYHIPETSTSAILNITNAKGQIVKTITLSNRGAGQINLNTQGLASGAYNYTLYVDGKQADSKRLVIAR